MRYKAGIIGLSGISSNKPYPAPDPAVGTKAPYSHASSYALMPEVEVVAVCDISSERIAQFRADWGHLWPEIRAYSDFKAMLTSERLDVLSVVTPDHFHAPIVELAAAQGVRAICCEKPIATTLEDADRMIAACKQHGTLLSIEHTRRWLPHWQEARRLARSGAIGRVTQIMAVLGGPRSMIFRNGTHVVDLVNFFAESDPAWVVAEVEPALTNYGTKYAGDGGHDPSTDPGLNFYAVYENGVRAYYCGMKDIPALVELTVLGTDGYMRLNDRHCELYTKVGDELVSRPLPYIYTTRASIHGSLGDLVECLTTGRAVASPPEDARRALSIILAALESHARGNVAVRCR